MSKIAMTIRRFADNGEITLSDEQARKLFSDSEYSSSLERTARSLKRDRVYVYAYGTTNATKLLARQTKLVVAELLDGRWKLSPTAKSAVLSS